MKLMSSVHEPTFLKAMSFLLALILWITTLCFRRLELKQDVRLEILLPLGAHLLNRVPSKIQLSLSGSRIMLLAAQERIQPIRLDLSKTQDSTVSFSLSEDILGELPRGVRVLSITPSQLILELPKKENLPHCPEH